MILEVDLQAEDFIVDVSSSPDNMLNKEFFLKNKDPPLPIKRRGQPF